MNRIIMFAVHADGYVVSRVGSEVAWPVLQWESMTPENSFTPSYLLEKFNMYSIGSEWQLLKWTKKVPLADKNAHRQFWGMKPVAANRWSS